MREVWQQIRNGRHPGFEEGEYWMWLSTLVCAFGTLVYDKGAFLPAYLANATTVWPVIASNLEFNPKAGSTEDAAMTM